MRHPIQAFGFGSLFVLLLVAEPARALDPSKSLTQYRHTAWLVRDGMLPGTPRVIAQTTDGYLWIGTERGLVRFDGVTFSPWTASAGPQLPDPDIMALKGSRDGGLWIGTL